mmetsp:Transcript_23364/g.55524  ORF Transcript_23364/g.55524 Transcript_23364/m.55524 type:complete len:341 (-) Transcript_23364:800-1822(-)
MARWSAWAWPAGSGSWPARCPAAGSSASRSPPACCTGRACCCWTNPRPASTPRRGASSGTRSICSPARASRCWSRRITWTRPSAAMSWSTSPTAMCWRAARRQPSSPRPALATWRMPSCGWWARPPTTSRRRPDAFRRPHLRDCTQGGAADAARPPDLRDGGGRAGVAAGAVRLRDQHRPQGPAGRGRQPGHQPNGAQRRRGAADQRLFPHRRKRHCGIARRRAAGARRHSVPDRRARRLRRPHRARRTAGAAGRGRCHRPLGFGQRHCRAEPACTDRVEPRAARAARHAGPTPRAVRGAHPAPLQPRRTDPLQHRARPDRHHPDHDHGHADFAGHDPRA